MAKAQATVMKNGNAVQHKTFADATYGAAYAAASYWATRKAASIGGSWRVVRVYDEK